MVPTLDLVRRKILSQRDRREPCPKQDLVRIGIADAAEEMRVGQGPLQGVVIPGQHRGESLKVGLENFNPARIVGSKGDQALYEMERSLFFRPGFGEHQTSVRKIKGREVPFAPEVGTRLLPVEPSGDHQVNDEPEIVLEADGDALADAPQRERPLFSAAGRDGSAVRNRKGCATRTRYRD